MRVRGGFRQVFFRKFFHCRNLFIASDQALIFSQITILTNFPEFSHFFKMKLVKLVISPKSAIFLLKSPTTRKVWSVWRCIHFLWNI